MEYKILLYFRRHVILFLLGLPLLDSYVIMMNDKKVIKVCKFAFSVYYQHFNVKILFQKVSDPPILQNFLFH